MKESRALPRPGSELIGGCEMPRGLCQPVELQQNRARLQAWGMLPSDAARLHLS